MFKAIDLRNQRQLLFFLFIVLLKFMFARSLLFENSNPLYTIFVEFGYLLFLFSLIALIPKRKINTTLYMTLNLMFTVLLLAIILYFNYYGHILTVHAFSLVGQVGAVSDSVLELFEPIYLLFFLDFIILAIYWGFKKTTLARGENISYKFIIPAMTIGALLIGFNLTIQNNNDIASTVVAAEKQGILTYEILTAKNTLSQGGETSVLSPAEREELKAKIYNTKEINPLPDEERRLRGIAKDKNVIVIQAEAYQDFTVNLEIDGQEITPFLNNLVDEGLYFPNVYQQIGAGNTSDAEFLFNTSLYPAAWTASSETYSDRKIPSFPKLLREKDYTSLTFHANEVTFWSRDQLYPALGFDRFYDIEFFGEEDVIGIGPSDEHVYEKAFPELKKLHDNGENFYAQFVTLSSHHPFKIPEDKFDLELPERYEGTLMGDYLESIHYTDLTLKQFVDDLKQAGMWEDTVLVFYGDHFGLTPDGIEAQDHQLFEEMTGEEYTFLDQFNIPFVIHVPGETSGEVIETIGGQIDMMPTVANLLDLSLEDHIHFGQDLINYPDNLFGVRYYMAYGSFFNNEVVFEPNEGFTDGEAYNLFTKDPLQDFSEYKADYDRIQELLKLSDNYMERLPER